MEHFKTQSNFRRFETTCLEVQANFKTACLVTQFYFDAVCVLAQSSFESFDNKINARNKSEISVRNSSFESDFLHLKSNKVLIYDNYLTNSK